MQCDIAHAAGNPHNLTGTTLQTHEYDGLGRKTRCTDNNEPGITEDDILCTYGYDTLSRKLEETCQIGALPAKVTSYKFDESLARAGNLDPTSMVYPDGREVELGYDDINRLNDINDAGHTSLVSYDYIGRTPRVLQKAHQNGTVRTITYDGIRRPTKLLTTDASQLTIIGFEHEYDAEDNKLSERKLHDPGNSEMYTYDSTYRLTTFDRGTLNTDATTITAPATTADALQFRDWTLDGIGNWSENETQTVGGNLDTTTRSHTNFNEIAREDNVTFGYDSTGNLITDDGLLYTWDALNRLRSVTDSENGELVASYTYDCQNRRMVKSVWDTTNSSLLTTHYSYSGWRVCEEYDFDGTTETPKNQYVWGAVYHDELVVRDSRTGSISIAELNNGIGGDRQFQHHNTLFSIFAVTDESGVVLERFQYDPYGNRTDFDASFNLQTSTIDQEYSYTGQRIDLDTGLYYYKNRYYSADQGRFISRDPIEYDGGMNLYCGYFAMMGGLDPFGEDMLDCMSKCIQDNDPIDTLAGKLAALAVGGALPKSVIIKMAEFLGYNNYAKKLKVSLKMPGVGKFTKAPKWLGAALQKMGVNGAKKLAGQLGKFSIPAVTAYGLALAAVEVQCGIDCCGK